MAVDEHNPGFYGGEYLFKVAETGASKVTWLFPDAGALAYQVVFSLVERQLSLGLSVVCGSPLAFERAYHVLRDTATAGDAKLLVVETRCDD